VVAEQAQRGEPATVRNSSRAQPVSSTVTHAQSMSEWRRVAPCSWLSPSVLRRAHNVRNST
jgi:hypothetical protein